MNTHFCSDASAQDGKGSSAVAHYQSEECAMPAQRVPRRAGGTPGPLMKHTTLTPPSNRLCLPPRRGELVDVQRTACLASNSAGLTPYTRTLVDAASKYFPRHDTQSGKGG